MALASDSWSFNSKGLSDARTVKVVPLFGRFAVGHAGSNGYVLDPERFDFSKTAPGESPPLLNAGPPEPARGDAALKGRKEGESALPVHLRRLETRLRPPDDVDSTLEAVRTYLLAVYEAELAVARRWGWNIPPWTAWFYVAGYSKGAGSVHRFSLSGDNDAVELSEVQEKLRGDDPAHHGITAIGETDFYGRWCDSNRWGVYSVEEVQRVAAAVLLDSVAESRQHGGSLGGEPQMVLVTATRAERFVYTASHWR